MPKTPRILLTAAVAIAAAALPPVASAATLHHDGRMPHRLLLQDEPGETNLISVDGSRSSVVIQDANMPITIDRVPTCMPIDAYTVSCAAVRNLDIELGDGPDVAVIDTAHAVSLEGGAGNDRYVALATEGSSHVDFEGGIGFDTANYGFATTGVDVAVDLVAGDGRPGDDDRIRRDVESVIGSPFDDVLSGSPRTERLAGQDGDDVITGGAGAELLSGGPGADRIDARDGGPDTVDCGGQTLDLAIVDLTEASITGCPAVAS